MRQLILFATISAISCVTDPEAGIEQRLVLPDAAQLDDTLAVSVTARNVSRDTMSFVVNGEIPLYVWVINPAGKLIWSLSTSQAGPGRVVIIAPGREARFEATWPLTDAGARAVPPGGYRIRAAISGGHGLSQLEGTVSIRERVP